MNNIDFAARIGEGLLPAAATVVVSQFALLAQRFDR